VGAARRYALVCIELQEPVVAVWFGSMSAPISFAVPGSLRTLGVVLLVSLTACGKLADESHAVSDAGDPVATAPTEDSWQAEALPPDTSHHDVTTPAACAGLPGTDEELALTPRADVEAEVLALRVGGAFTADSPTYERIRRDLASIRKRVPLLERVRGYLDSNRVALTVDKPAFASMEAGTYTAWDCLHARYGWHDEKLDDYDGKWSPAASGRLSGRYDEATIVSLYEQLPGITSVRRYEFTGNGPTVCASREADQSYHYVFDDASGDCPSGCIDHHYYYFVSQPDGRITNGGEHVLRSGDTPDWVKLYGRGPHCL
jgi:hypothetical protein